MNEVVIYTRQNPEGARSPVNGQNPLPVYSSAAPSSTNAAVDAFGRGRVSQPTTIFDSQPQYDKQPLLWDEKIGDAATATHLPNESSIELAVTNANASSIIRQTKEYFRYQPGKSQLILCTFVMGNPVADVLKLVGYGDDENGLFMGQDTNGTFMLLRSNVTGTPSDARKVYMADWNVDPMDGTGPSGITLDMAKTQILVIDLEWLGVGRVRMGLNIDGATFYVHEFLNANVLGTTYTTTANLPIRYQLTNLAPNGGPTTMKQICCQVASEGGVDESAAFPFTSTPRLSLPVPDATPLPLVAIRPALTFNGITNRTKIILNTLQYIVSSGEAVIQVLYNPTITGGAWAAVDSQSAVEENITATAVSGGTVIATLLSGVGGNNGVISGAQTLDSRLPFTLDIDGANPDVIALVAYEITGTPVVSGAASWKEIR